MATRMVEREESMAFTAWHLRDNAPRSTHRLLIDGHVIRLGTSLVRFTRVVPPYGLAACAMAACVGALPGREVAMCVKCGHFLGRAL